MTKLKGYVWLVIEVNDNPAQAYADVIGKDNYKVQIMQTTKNQARNSNTSHLRYILEECNHDPSWH